MKQFVDAEIKVTRFEYENMMNDTDIGGTMPDLNNSNPDANPDDFSLWGE